MAIDPTPYLLIPSCADCAAMGFHVADFLHDMEADLGADALRDFLLAHGGQQISVPMRRETGQPQSTDATALDWLAENVGWGKLTLPKGPTAHRVRVSFTVLALRREGRSVRQIATAIGIHSRSVSKILQRLAERGDLITPSTS